MIDEEVGKYKKKTKSNISKSKTKSRHKHEYKEVLLVCAGKPHWATVCKICGKVNDLHFYETQKCEIWYRTLDADEVFEKYKNLEQIQIDDIWQKFVPVIQQNGE